MTRSALAALEQMIDKASTILLLQPDKPDGDSLASMLALEEMFATLGKQTVMYCAGRVEPYLSHLPGWDRVRVAEDWPTESWDVSILVDTAVADQVARLLGAHHAELARRPWIRFDHHDDHGLIEGVDLDINDPAAAATGELLYSVAKRLKWELTPPACSMLIASLYADTLNLTTPKVSVATVSTFAELVRRGNVNVSELHSRYREAAATDPDLLRVKGELLTRLELFADGRVALVVVPTEVLKAYRERTSLSALIMFEMLWSRGVRVAVVMSDYGTVIRTSIRSRVPIAGVVAESFGGGGHPQAAAFADDSEEIYDLKTRLVLALREALDRDS